MPFDSFHDSSHPLQDGLVYARREVPLSPIAADEAENRTWDAVIVGTGMGGAALGYALARSGLEVLFL